MSDLQIAMRAAKTNRIRALTYGAPLSCSGAWAPRLSTRQSPSPPSLRRLRGAHSTDHREDQGGEDDGLGGGQAPCAFILFMVYGGVLP